MRHASFPTAPRKRHLIIAGVAAVSCAIGARWPTLRAQTDPASSGIAAVAPTPILAPATNTDAVVEASEAFLAMLTEQQRAVAVIELTPANAGRWSNLPAGAVPRNGLYFRDLTPEQTAAAMKVARLALGEEGLNRFQELRAADEAFGKDHGRGGPNGRPPGAGGPPPGAGAGGPPPPNGGAGRPEGRGPDGGPGRGPVGSRPGGGMMFSAGNYIIAMMGQPSKTAPWLLQFGGHHIAFNIYYKGTVGASTPYFLGVQPNRWKDDAGKEHEPLAPMREAMRGLLKALTPEQLQRAHLEARFNDVYVGPGKDGRFPAKSEGVPVSELSAEAKALVTQAIAAWTGDAVQAAEYRKLYASELEQTKVAWSGDAELSKGGDYVRLDGPHLWIEFATQGGDHYHTIWRDRSTDYGAEFHF